MTQKKQVLFVCYGLGIGGIEKSLVNLLNVLPEEEFDVDVLLMSPQYTMKSQIRRNVHFFDELEYIIYSGGAVEALRSRGGLLRNWKQVLKLIPFRYLDQNGGNGYRLFKKLPKTYDIAIAYSQNGYPLYYVADKVKAKRKVLWYHNGTYEYDQNEQDRHCRYYPKFDNIVTVSDYCAAMLKKTLPFIQEKIIVLPNVCDTGEILEKAGCRMPESFDKERCHVVTVGRMSREKGVLLALEACSMLHKQGKNICWHWVGDGNMAQKVRQEVTLLGLTEHFILEGDQDNPYPYIAFGDIYVQPSYYEAYSNTVTEAMVLHKPIIVTDVGGMGPRLNDGVNGFVVPVSADAIAKRVVMLAEDKSLRFRFSEAVKKSSCDTGCELEEYYQTVFS